MDDKMRARTYYAAAVSLFQGPSTEECERAIERLNKAVELYPDFSEASIFREEVWHCLLKSLDPNNDLGTYEKYRNSPAWHRKRDVVRERDGGQCICGAKAADVHHKTYDNIGKEPLSDLVMLCKGCHNRLHQQSAIQGRHPMHYTKNTYSPVSRTEALGAQSAKPEISSETKQNSPQIAPGKSPKSKEKKKQLYHWCHKRGSHRGVTEGFFAENDDEAKRIVEIATSANRWKKSWQKQNRNIDEYVKNRGDGESIKLFKCRGISCEACRAN